MEENEKKVFETVSYIRERIIEKPDIAIILGSGLGGLAYEIQNRVEIPYDEVPNFKNSLVEGHEGKLIIGKIYDKNVIAMQGRIHFYEGYSMQDIAFPIRVFALLGVEVLIVTNAAGGIDPRLSPGSLMMITDHINMSLQSPLTGKNSDTFGPRFPAINGVYDKGLMTIAKSVASEMYINLHEGVYAFMPGPQYETDAEIKMLKILGADAVGMSTVPEVIAAAHSGIKVLGISCIANAAWREGAMATHNEVLENASKVEKDFVTLVMDTIRKIPIENKG
jgi:purine-nucleoside phosphorylase